MKAPAGRRFSMHVSVCMSQYEAAADCARLAQDGKRPEAVGVLVQGSPWIFRTWACWGLWDFDCKVLQTLPHTNHLEGDAVRQFR